MVFEEDLALRLQVQYKKAAWDTKRCERTNHRREHAANTPHVKAVVVPLIANKQFGGLVVPRTDADVVLCVRVVKFCQSPVDQTKLRCF